MSASKEPQECFYCGELTVYGEKDHFPKPKEVGGTEVVWACVECHDFKDRFKLQRWQKTLKQAMYAEWGISGDDSPLPPVGLVVYVTVATLQERNEWPWLESPNDELLWLLDGCKSWELRVFLAKVIRSSWVAIGHGAICRDEEDRVVDRRVEWQCELRKKPAA